MTICNECRIKWPCALRRSNGPDWIHYPERVNPFRWVLGRLWDGVRNRLGEHRN